ncbi:Hypothetical predicted protein [Paramuricea clavata]|uniref:Uncharacterized protein n=1 Tax=Paramuricea clavata TaxID=317549 RepID=A0A6S7FN85_PARCT|nr:Hypothetical predicted protein [Paramuricea clavata]
MDSAFTKFVELSGITVTENTDLTPILADYWSFTAFASAYPDNIYELNFIKWRLSKAMPKPQQTNTTPQSQPSPQQPQYQMSPRSENTVQYAVSPQQILVVSPSRPAEDKILTKKTDYHSLPTKLERLKKYVSNVEGTFSSFSLTKSPEPLTTIESNETNKPVDDATLPALNFNIDDYIPDNETPMIYTEPISITHRGKDIVAAKKHFEENERAEEEGETSNNMSKKTPAKKPVSRKRKRDSGRPTNDEQLIRMDEDYNDMQSLQLTRRQLTLPDSRGKCKKSKKILTKITNDIIVNTGREFQTFELFANVREEALKIIQEKRELLENVNAAEYVLHTLLKKQNNSDSSN